MAATTTTEKVDFAEELKSQHFSGDGGRSPARRLTKTRVKPTELILFTTQLSVMLDSGVVLSDALDAISTQAMEQSGLKAIVEDAAETVKSGESFSTALAAYPKVFSSMFISMVKASEASGRMSEMLSVLSGYLGFELETRKRIKGALTYPMIMGALGIVAMGVMMFFVLPRFTKIFESRGSALPKLTQILVDFSKIISNPQAMTMIITTAILAVAGLYIWTRTSGGRRIIAFAKIRTPVLGTMFVDMVVTRSMRIMATMINTGVSLLDTIEVIQGTCDNYYFHRLWSGADEKIRAGYQLSEAIQASPSGELIDAGIIQMLRAGEKSGKLGEVSDKISVFYEKKLEGSIKSVMALIEPLMISVLGAVIGTIAIALLLPVFKISSVISQ